MMEDNFEKYLRENIKALPEIKHETGLWDRIYDELDFEDRLSDTCKNLPLHKHNDQLWDSIRKSGNRTKVHRNLIYISGIAASLIILVITYLQTHSSRDYTISYSTEMRVEYGETNTMVSDNQDVDLLLDQICRYSILYCKTSEFAELKNQLVELDANIKEVNNTISSYGESPGLVKCLIKMENQKSVLVNELINRL